MKTLIIFLFCSLFVFAQQSSSFINVNGTAEITKEADQMKFHVQIRTVEESIEASKTINDKMLAELMSVLNSQNISSEDIESSPISLGKNYEHSDRGMVHKGYFTSITVSFLLKDLNKYYDLTNRLSANNSYEINSEYLISDYEIQHRKAYENALAAAKNKAEYMAAALNMKLGTVLEIDEVIQGYNPIHSNTFSKEESGGVAGKVTIIRTVRVKFSIN